VKPGDTFFDRTAGIPWHLWVVVAALDDGSILAVNFSHHREGCDETCIVEPGAHPSIPDKSFAFYRRAQLLNADYIERSIADRLWGFADPLPDALLASVQRGAVASPFTARGFKDLVRKATGIEQTVVAIRRTRPRKPGPA